jgi:hypothetical protein
MHTTHAICRLATRRTDANPNHHLMNNNGTWWIRFTLRSTAGESIRLAYSLKTPDLETARTKRDRFLLALQSAKGGIAA